MIPKVEVQETAVRDFRYWMGCETSIDLPLTELRKVHLGLQSSPDLSLCYNRPDTFHSANSQFSRSKQLSLGVLSSETERGDSGVSQNRLPWVKTTCRRIGSQRFVLEYVKPQICQVMSQQFDAQCWLPS